ncbi:MAG: ABC transporter ATP-binding protein [Kiritimatiellae bacterium]|nr:ABC transporter ATP-binding protein [Kiritimatiellia bacterium]
MPADNHVIDVRGVTKRFDGKTVVNQLSLQVNQGEIFGFLGPNGSGKTTFLRMICGLLHMDEGEGTCLGYKIRTHPAEIKRQTGYMTQRFSFYEDLTIKENLDFVARVYEMPNRKQRVQEGLEQLGLVSRCNQLAGALSGGWKQRLALAACLLHRPKLLLLDEPTAGVDPSARRDFWEEVHRLASEGMTVLITTHYMDEAERCHRLAYISYGDLLAQGTAEELIEQSGLHTWEVAGPGVASLTESLRELGGVEQVAAFGNALHISGHDQVTLQHSLDGFAKDPYRYRRIDSGLEDVFVSLMRQPGGKP